MFLQQNDHILFYGDSITDWGRTGNNPNDGMGVGFPYLCSAHLQERFPRMGLKFTNQGISGNRICDLESRLANDVLPAKPTVVSLLIGVNDTWHQFSHGKPSPLPEFAVSYRRVLDSLKAAHARLVIMEPFLLHTTPNLAIMRDDLNQRITIVRDLARQLAALYIPLDGMFQAAATTTPMQYWASDGIHPTPAGRALIANAWIDAVTK
jgi:lysophospholipase L1-like esterase